MLTTPVLRVSELLRSKSAKRLRTASLYFTASALAWAASAVAQASVQQFPGPVAVGTQAPTQPVSLTVQGTVASIRVVTQGETGLDFQDAGGGSCTTQSYPVSTTCTVNVTVLPTAPGRRNGAVLLIDSTHHVLASQAIDVVATGPMAVVHFGVTSTIAGVSDDWRYRATDEGKPATSATIYLPQGVVADDAGVFYLSDTINARIRKVAFDPAYPNDQSKAVITTYAGIGYPSNNGDNGPATSAGVSGPTGLALDGAGNLYIADSGNNSIRRVDAVSGIITTIAGQSAQSGWAGDGGVATSAQLAAPNGLAFDASGNLYIADTGNNAIRRVDTSGIITTFAGGPNAVGGDGSMATQAALKNPWSIAFALDGTMYIADLSNHAVRRINAALLIETVAGTLGTAGFDGDGGLATGAHLKGPAALAVDPAGNIYIADSGNNRIRRVDVASGKINTLIGDGLTSYQSTPQNSNLAMLYGPYALSMNGKGNIYIADYFHNVIRFVASNASLLQYETIRVSKTSAPQQVLIDNDGNGSLAIGAFDFNQSALSADSTTTCASGTSLAVGTQCSLGVEFAPTQISPANGVTSGSFTMHSNGSNAPDVVNISGQVLSVEPTAAVLTSNLNPAAVSGNVTFTATVSETQGTSVPTGMVTFLDGSTPIGTAVALDAHGIASISTSVLGLGQHTITASYAGDASNAAVVSNAVTESIVQATQISVTSSLNPSSVLQDVTFTATVTAGTPVTSGVITFLDGGTAIGTASVGSNSTATFTTHNLGGGTHQITARFPGDVSSQTSTSAALQQTVNRVSSSTLLSASPSTALVGTGVLLSATVTSNGGPVPTGTVTFKSGSTIVGTTALDGTGSASFTATTLAPGTDAVTAVYGGDSSNLTSTSVSTTVTVNRLATDTTLGSSALSANAGSAVQLTATVTLGAGQNPVGAITGIVTFYDGATVLGSQQIVNGSAVLTTSTLTVGSHSISASYSGSTNYDVSTSASISQTVQISSSTTLLSLSSSTLPGGKPLTMTATVNTAGVKATGNVTFTDGATVLGTSPLNSGAVASLTVTTLAVGPHSIVATYNHDLNYGVSASTTAPFTVTIGNTVLTLAGSASSAVYGTSITLTTSLTSDAVLASNPPVVLTDNGSALTTLTLSSGHGSFTSSTLSVGTHTIVASYAGDGNNSTAQSQSVTITIAAASTNTTLVSSAPTLHFGNTVTLQANVTSGLSNLTGSVTFQEGGTNLGTVGINAAGVASLQISNFSVAQHSIVALYSGDSTHATSSSTVLLQSVVDPTTISISSNINPSIGGNAVVFTAQVAGAAANSGVTAAPTGTMVFHEGGNVLGTVQLDGAGAAALTTSSLSVGTHNIVATYSGDIRYGSNDSAVLTQTIRNASSQSTLTTGTNPSVYAAPLVLTVHVTGNGGAPTGNVNFLDGTILVGQAPLSSAGTAVFTTSTLAPGIHSLSAIYVGDGNNSSSTSAAVNQQVQQATQLTLASSNNPALTLQQPTLTATVRTVTGAFASGNVRFMDGSVLLGTAVVSSGVATLVPGAFGAGTHSITAAYGGDTSDLQSVSTALALVVNLRSTQNTVTAALPTTLSGGVLTLISVLKYDGPSSPTGVTTFSTAKGIIGSSSVGANGIATLNVQGSAIPGLITATYSGDAAYAASTSSPTDITTAAATNFTLSVTPAIFTVVTKQYSVAQITIHSNDGFADTINLGCLGLPYAATCTFDHDSIKLPANGTVVVTVNIDTGSPLTGGGQASASVQTTHGSSALALLPAGAVLALLAFGRRRRNVPAPLLLLLATALVPVIGCGTINQKSTPAGAYTIAISAVGQGTGVTLSQGLNMTVTQ